MAKLRERIVSGCWFLALSPLFLLSCVIGSCMLVIFVPLMGRISDFQTLRDGVSLDGTNYQIVQIEKSFVLRNRSTGTQIEIEQVHDYYPPQYYLLKRDYGPFLIIEKENGGSASGYYFNIFDLSQDKPRRVSIPDDVWDSFSCVFPRVEGDRLEFESAEKCDLYPLLTRESIRAFYISLH